MVTSASAPVTAISRSVSVVAAKSCATSSISGASDGLATRVLAIAAEY
nr:hypothetical protein [Microlunatus phosphovorus]